MATTNENVRKDYGGIFMKYEEIVAKAKEILANKDVSDYQKHLAIQFNITGEGEGAFYIELSNGNVYVEPFEYYDRDLIVTISGDDILAILDGSLDTTAGYVENRIDVENLGILNEFYNVIKEAKTKEIVVEEVVAEPVVEPVKVEEPVETKEVVESVVEPVETVVETPVVEKAKEKKSEKAEKPAKTTRAKSTKSASTDAKKETKSTAKKSTAKKTTTKTAKSTTTAKKKTTKSKEE
jgi:hypothetical protein